MDLRARILGELDNGSTSRQMYYVDDTTKAGLCAEVRHLRQLLDTERASHKSTRMQLSKRDCGDSDNEKRAYELHHLAHYLGKKVISPEKTVERLSVGEDVKVVLYINIVRSRPSCSQVMDRVIKERTRHCQEQLRPPLLSVSHSPYLLLMMYC